MAKRGTRKTATAVQERTFGQEWAEVQSRAQQTLAAQRKELAQKYARRAEQTVADMIKGGNNNALKEAWKEYKRVQRELEGDTNGHTTTRATASGGERKRRDESDLKDNAEKIAKLIRDNPDISGVNLSAKLMAANVAKPPNVKAFVEKWTDHKVETKGERRNMTYKLKG